MTLSERISSDLKEAMKAKNESLLSTLRMVKSAMKNKQIDLMRELTNEDVLAVIKSQMKQLKDTEDSMRGAGRADLADRAKEEITVLSSYMPAQLDDAALTAIVKEALASQGITSKADMGKAMGAVMKAVGNQADGNRVRAIVSTLLV